MCSKVLLCDAVRPVEVISGLKDQEVEEMQPVHIRCILSKAGQNVLWYKDGTHLRSDDHLKISDDDAIYNLDIAQALVKDAGRYVMKHGENETSCSLKVQGNTRVFFR